MFDKVCVQVRLPRQLNALTTGDTAPRPHFYIRYSRRSTNPVLVMQRKALLFLSRVSGMHRQQSSRSSETLIFLSVWIGVSLTSSTLPYSRYRKQRGVNLGSFFTLEAWLTPSIFNGIKDAKSEHDLCKQLGEQEVRERLERHWNSFIDEGDWQVNIRNIVAEQITWPILRTSLPFLTRSG
jgi:hypothetical protein